MDDISSVPTWDSTAPIEAAATPQIEGSPVAEAAPPPTWDSTVDPSQYETTGQMIKTGLEGAAEGVLGPLAPLIETQVFGVDPNEARARAEINPITKETFKAAGLIGGLATGVGEGALMAKTGVKAAEAVGLGAKALEGASLAAKVGSSAVSQAAEMAILQSGDEVSKMILKDPEVSAESAIANVGLAAVLGGAAGGALTGIGHGLINPLWKATAGPKVDSLLSAMKSRMNNETSSTLLKEAEDLGIAKKLTPDLEGAMSDDPMLKNAASGLRQTDTSKLSRGFQEREMAFKDEVSNKMAEALGKESRDLSTIEVSEATHGKDIGDLLTKEYKSKIDPIIKDLEESKAKFANTPLDKDVVSQVVDNSNPYQSSVKEVIQPGTTKSLSDKLLIKAQEEGWMADKLSPEARMIRTAAKTLQNIETLQDLVKFGQNIGNSTKSTLPFGMQTPLSRAGAIVRDMVRDAENDMILRKLSKESPELVSKFRGALSNFKEVAQLKDAINDRIKVNGSVSGFAKGLAEMARTDSETLLRRLNGKNDANLLNFLTEHFPETANRLKTYHIDKMLEKATVDGQLVPSKFVKQMNAMSPELRDFSLGKEAVDKVHRLDSFLTRLEDHSHNYSNTARTVDKILSSGAASATGLIAALMGHGGIGVAIPIAEIVGKEGVAATRLGMLKFLGSSQPIKSEGFKAMITHLDAIYKNEHMLNKAITNIFKSGAQVLTSSQMPNKADREKLDKVVTKLQDKPGQALQLTPGGNLGHYMPDQQAAMTASSMNALKYLQHIKPQPHILGPLDKPVPPQPSEIARYNRALDIATNPNIMLDHIKNGTLMPSDIDDIHTMYPALYKQMSQKISNQIATQQGAEQPIPYKTRVSMSMFLGQPLDASMTPSAIMAAQPMKPQQAPPTPGAKPGKAKNAPSALGKTNKNYMTPSQGAESDRANRND